MTLSAATLAVDGYWGEHGHMESEGGTQPQASGVGGDIPTVKLSDSLRD